MHKPLVWVGVCLLVYFGLARWGATSLAEPMPWTIEDLVAAETASDWTLSRDGRLAAWVQSGVRQIDDAEKIVESLWLKRPQEAARQITRHNEDLIAPVFSPRGRWLAFLSDRLLPFEDDEAVQGKQQVWILPLDGGEAQALTHFDRDVLDLAWQDEDTLLVLAPEARSAWEQERDKRQDTAVVVDDAAHEPPVRLFRVSVPDGEVTRLTTNVDWIDAMAVSPDGAWAVVTAQQSLTYEFDQKIPPHTLLVDLKDGTMRRILADSRLLPEDMRWAPDASGFYFTNQFSHHARYREAAITELYFFNLGRQRAEPVDLHWPRGLGGDYAPTADGVIALLADGVRYRPARLLRTADGWKRLEISGRHASHVDTWRLAGDGQTLLYVHSTATKPPQAYMARLEGSAITAEQRITSLNAAWEGKPTGTVEVLRWPGARGEEVEGLLYYPLAWRSGRRYPLVLDIHGGPAAVDRDTWEADWLEPGMLWRERGAFVLQVNYHGSSGYGLEWVESIGAGHYYELEIPDLEAGVDVLIARGLVDPERLGVTGWSNGGILGVELMTRSHRYRAASIGAAGVEWISDWASVDFGAVFNNYYLGASPFENPQRYLEKSPFLRLSKVTTPTIVFSGTEDRNVSPNQSWLLYRGLQQTTSTPVRLVLFPGEAHGLVTVAHQRRKLEEETAWFDRYLFGQDLPRRPWLRPASPLQALLQRAGAAHASRAFGRREYGILVPETVPFQGLDIGRFEVTRAQFQAFDPHYACRPGDENLPASGVSLAQARAYVAWLAQRTGRPFRLPTAAEAQRLAEAADDGEGNTLAYWAGYTPNPTDARHIAEALGGLSAAAPLLLPVGSFPGTGQPPVFDLDGNVAEWTADGSAAGPSADRADDPRGKTTTPAPAYTGLRVVVSP